MENNNSHKSKFNKIATYGIYVGCVAYDGLASAASVGIGFAFSKLFSKGLLLALPYIMSGQEKACEELTEKVNKIAAEMGLEPKYKAFVHYNSKHYNATVFEQTLIFGPKLLDDLNHDELDFVIRHEFGHIVNGDTHGAASKIENVMAPLATAIAREQMALSGYANPASDWLFAAMLAPAAIEIITSLPKRLDEWQKELDADKVAVLSSKNPKAAISALYKLAGQKLEGTAYGNATHPAIIDRMQAVKDAMSAPK